MRRYVRPTLNVRSRKWFAKWTNKIQQHASPETEAPRLWKQSRPTEKVRDAVKQLVEMNGNIEHCMYCEHDTATDVDNVGTRHAIVDHWKPIVEDRSGAFDWNNMFLSCHRCNTTLKADNFPKDANGNPLLLHLVTDNPIGEIKFTPATGALSGTSGSARGQPTVDFFKLSDFDKRRKEVFEKICSFLRDMGKSPQPCACRLRQNCPICAFAKSEIFHPEREFRSLLHYMVAIAAGPHAAHLLGQDIVDIINNYNIKDWL